MESRRESEERREQKQSGVADNVAPHDNESSKNRSGSAGHTLVDLSLQADTILVKVTVDAKPLSTAFKLTDDVEETLDNLAKQVRALGLSRDCKREVLSIGTDWVTNVWIERGKKREAQVVQAKQQSDDDLAQCDQAARDWLSGPRLLYLLEDAICSRESDDFLVGEEENAMYLLFNIIGELSVEVRGQSAGGKNSLVDHVLSVIPSSWWRKITGLSDKAIRYLPQGMRILYVAERRGIGYGEESTAEYDVKVGISEGTITVALAVARDGNVETIFKEVRIGSFIFTSTEIEAPPELENRLNPMTVSDDPKHNELVRDEQLRKAKMLAWQKKDYSNEKKIAQRCVQLVDEEAPKDVIIPYTSSLKPILNVNDTVVRRNTPKILELIGAIARLHYMQRPSLEGPDGKKTVVALPADVWIAIGIGSRALQHTLSVIPEKLEPIIAICEELTKDNRLITTHSVFEMGRTLTYNLGMSLRAIQQMVKALDERGVLVKRFDDEGRLVKGHHGAFVYDLSQSTATTGVYLDLAKILRDATEEYEEWCCMIQRADLITAASAISWPGDIEVGAIERRAPESDAIRPATPEYSSSVQNTALLPKITVPEEGQVAVNTEERESSYAFRVDSPESKDSEYPELGNHGAQQVQTLSQPLARGGTEARGSSGKTDGVSCVVCGVPLGGRAGMAIFPFGGKTYCDSHYPRTNLRELPCVVCAKPTARILVRDGEIPLHEDCEEKFGGKL